MKPMNLYPDLQENSYLKSPRNLLPYITSVNTESNLLKYSSNLTSNTKIEKSKLFSSNLQNNLLSSKSLLSTFNLINKQLETTDNNVFPVSAFFIMDILNHKVNFCKKHFFRQKNCRGDSDDFYDERHVSHLRTCNDI